MQCCQLSNIADPFSDLFFPSKKRPNLVSENHWYCRASARLLSCSSQRAHTPLSLSLRLLSARQREEQRFNSVKHRYYVASLILHASISRNHSTANCLYLCVFDFIRRRCDYHDFFVQINILEGRWLCTLVLMVTFQSLFHIHICCLTTETVKYTSFIENLASSKYSMWAKIGKQM